MAAAIGDRAALPVHTMYTTGRSLISLASLSPEGTGRPYGCWSRLTPPRSGSADGAAVVPPRRRAGAD